MARSIYFINPESAFPTYYSAEVFAARGYAPTALVADLAIATLAGMAPDDFQVTLTDENISPVDLDSAAEIVALTGKVNQWPRMRALADAFRARGRIVMIGGPFASLSPDVVRPHCDILVRGEIEEIHPRIFADLRDGSFQDEYLGTRPDLASCVLPRWDAYPNSRASYGMVQTSRGCPFQCEFCDVIVYQPGRQRHKPIPIILAELDALYGHGYRSVFIADDNFTVFRSRAKEVLEALKWWNARRTDGRVSFVTQVSIDAARDGELLELCAAAGLNNVFIGIETPNQESLTEARKRQNRVPLVEAVEAFVRRGVSVMGGMICGFDHDGPDIFERQLDFAMATPIMHFSLGALVAPAATPLYARLAAEGRLVPGGSEVAAMPWDTAILPRRMSREALLEGVKGLARRLYHPQAYGARVVKMIESFGADNPAARQTWVSPRESMRRRVDKDSLRLIFSLKELGPEEAALWGTVRAALRDRPWAELLVYSALTLYLQVRHMYEVGQVWEPHIAPAGLGAAS